MRLGLLALPVGVLAALAVATAGAKEGARARLTTALPLEAAPGTTIRVGWQVDVPDESGGRRPFGAGGMFVRLLSRTGAPATTTFTSGHGSYAAEVTVPAGGIGGIRFGLRGMACAAACRRGDLLFPLENDPFTSAGGVRCDVSAVRAALKGFVRAYDGGDLRRLDRLFSRERFVWYSSGGPGLRVDPDAGNRETLIPYFRARHGHGDRLRLLTFRFNGFEPQRELGHFELTGQRRADDFVDGSWFPFSGKGALDCSKPPVRIAVLSLGGPAR